MAVDFKKVLGVAKKNVVSISAGVIALAAIVVPFVVVDGMVAETQTKLDERKSKHDTLTQLSSKERKLINVNPTVGEVKPLEGFPTEAKVKAGEAAKEALTAESAKVLDAAVKLSQRDPLVPNLFISGGDAQTQFRRKAGEFVERYRVEILEGLTKRVHGSVPFTAMEIANALQAKKLEIEQQMSVRQGGQVINQQAVMEAQRKAEIDYPQQIRNSVALKNQVYLNPDTWWPEPELMTPGTVARPESAWFGQLGIWIQQEVADVVRSINGNSPNVFSSPIKHLVAVRYLGGQVTGQYNFQTGPYIVTRATGAEGGVSAVPLTGVDPAAAITPAKGVTLTGRQASGLYDAVGFYMVIRVDESKVTEVLAAIPRGRFINVLNVSMRSIDSDAAIQEGFVYGKAPVVELLVECEMLMLRKWYAPMMPAGIRQAIGIDQPVAPVNPGMGGM